jgi:hypothetical protein
MKRRAAVLTVLFLLFGGLVTAQSTFSQQDETFDYNRAYQDYIHNFDIYRQANEEYITARAQYLKYQTLKSKEEAREATLKMLEARDKAVETYLTALRMKLKATEGVPNDRREGVFFRIDQEVQWFIDHKEKLPSAGSLEDLVDDSKEASKRFESIEPLFYETLIVISNGKVRNIREKQSEILALIKGKMSEIKGEEREDYQFSMRKINLIERWILETENRLMRSEEKETEALGFIVKLEPDTSLLRNYNQAQFKLEEALQYLKEANPFLKEIVKEMMTEE